MHSDFAALCGADGAKNPASGEYSLLIPCITGNLDGDGFAADCHHHVAGWSSSGPPLLPSCRVFETWPERAHSVPFRGY